VPTAAHRLLDGVLRLPKKARLELAARLIASAEPPGRPADATTWNAAWARELDRRWADAERTGDWGEPWRAPVKRSRASR